jgi:hypothetical protein
MMLKKYFVVMDNTPVEEGKDFNNIGIAVCKGHTKHKEKILADDADSGENSMGYIYILGSIIGISLCLFAFTCVRNKRN